MNSHLPNLLTAFRIVIIPIFVTSFYLDPPLANWLAFGLFALAGVTDFLDGYLARAKGLHSRLGEFLDPIADKLIVAAALLMLVAVETIEDWHVVAALVILCREILVSGLREFLAGAEVSVPVSRLAKGKTTLQIIAIGFLLVGDAAPDPVPATAIGLWGLWIAAVLTFYTGYDYFVAGWRHLTEELRPKP